MATSTAFAGFSSYGRYAWTHEEIVPLYTNHTTTDNGTWLDMSGAQSVMVVVNGITTGTVNLRGFNSGTTAPAASEHGEELKSALTADGVWSLERKEIPRWVKVYISAGSNITLDVDLKRVRLVGE